VDAIIRESDALEIIAVVEGSIDVWSVEAV